jgi:DNA-binding transcriptional LysR family regulator
VEAVARHANFTSAAAELGVAQPSLSHAVRNLEVELGVQLFERTSRYVAVTDAGQLFLARARTILGEVDGLAYEMAEHAGAVQGRVRLGSWYHLEPQLPELLRVFVREHPLVELSIVERPAPEMLDALRHGELDVVFPVVTPQTDLSGLECVVVREEPLVMVVAASDPLARLDSVPLAALATKPYISLRPGTATRQWLDGVLTRAGVQVRIAVESNEIAAMVAFVSIGLGAALLTRSIVTALDHVALIPISDAPPFRLGLAWRAGGYRSPAAQGFLDLARRMLVSEDGDPPRADRPD